MEKVITTSTTSYDEIKRLIKEFKRTKDVLKEAMENLKKCKDLREEQDTLSYENDKYDVGVSELLKISAEGGVI